MVVTVAVNVLSQPQSVTGGQGREDHFLSWEESGRNTVQATPWRVKRTECKREDSPG